MNTWANRWAVVTGASSGIGAEFARQLAARGMHLVLTARREDRLNALAEELKTKHGADTDVLAGDLSHPDEPARIFNHCMEHGRDVAMLVNNAGFGKFAAIGETPVEDAVGITQVNMTALTDLTYRFLGPMRERDEGAILNVASVAGFQPVAYMPVYSASKAYVLHLTEALWGELRDTNVVITAVCPGTTSTEFFDQAGDSAWLTKHSSHTPAYVVRAALKAVEAGRPVYVPGWKNWVATQLSRYFPRKLVVLETRKYYRPRGGGKKGRTDSPADGSVQQQDDETRSASGGDAAHDLKKA